MSPVQTRLEQDHRELRQLLLQLSQDARDPSGGALRSTWDELERRLLAHMEAEEQYLLPLIEGSHPALVDCTRKEHAQIRRLLCELGVAIELHAVREPMIGELIRTLEEHSEREEPTLYRFAGEKASVAVQHRIIVMLRDAVRLAIAAASRAAVRVPPRDSGRAHP